MTKQELSKILENQIEFLEKAQEKCIEKGAYDQIAPISRNIIDTATFLLRNQQWL